MQKNFEEQILHKLENLERIIKNKQKPFLTVEELSTYLGISKNSIYMKVQNNEIPFYRLGKKRLIFKTSEIDFWVLEPYKKTESTDEIEMKIATDLLNE
jgi:excisionase family DNA binding protein